MTVSQQDTIDFTEMYSTHDAFRRDLVRFEAASAAGKAGAPGVKAGWENFKTQLLIHHSVEDVWLWPRLQREVADRPGDLALLEEMEAEHARIDPLLAAVDGALTGQGANLAEGVQELSAVLGYHLKHEEDSALPLIQSVLTNADWRGFKGAMTRKQGIRGAAVYIPWIIDGIPPADQDKFLAKMPAPARLINRLIWKPRYQQRNLWSF
ncbi:MAG TPA: hemerythrin domain-containing protein [Streptosporangiaceae bacterium]